MPEEKKEIEDILAEPEKEELDIEEAISEPEEPSEETPDIEPEPEEEVAIGQEPEETETSDNKSETSGRAKKEKPAEKKSEKKEKPVEPKKKDEKDILEKAVLGTDDVEQGAEAEGVLERPKKAKKKWWKIALVVLLTALVTAAVVLGVVYWLTMRNEPKTDEPKAEETKTEEPVEETAVDKSVYVNAVGGLNLRKEPNQNAEILAIIPNATKLTPLETSGDWIKVEYDGKTGWVKSEFTTTVNPLVYQNTDYGFSLTFPSTWSGYKFFKKTVDGVTVYYVALPTTDKNWTESAAEPGYASFFTIGAYTAAQWQAIQSEEMKPTKIGEKGNCVFTFSSGQATPTDLTARFSEIKSIIETFKTT